jgi:PAS domain S-box-containing protein
MHTTDNSIRALLIEDNPGDVRLIEEMLREAKGRNIVLDHCATLAQGFQELSKNTYDIMLLDLSLPDSKGYDTFIKVFSTAPKIPIVVLTGTNDEELAVKSVRTGAQDYLVKSRIDSSLLEKSIAYAIERAGLLRIVQQELIGRKVMETMLRKVNRALRMLSECNEIVVRASEEQILAEKICHVITTVGEYQFAWIAFTEPDDGKFIQPIAIASSEGSHSPEEASAWFMRDSGSPLSEALTTRRVIVCDDVMVDKRCSNLRAEADKLGYRSFVILPLVSSDKTLGVVHICSKGLDRFDREELNLLHELKEDIEYAIVAIRSQKERRRAEEEIKMLAKFPSENPSPILRIDRDGIILNANEASRALLQDWDCSLGDCVPTFWREVIMEVLTCLERKTIEIKLGERCFSFFVIPISEAGYVNLYGLDITERKRAEDELKESEGKFRGIFDNASDGMFIVDLKARKFFMCNAACAKMLGYAQEEFSTLDIATIHPEEDLPFINDQIMKFSREEAGVRSDIRFKRRDGSIFAADLSPALLTIAEKKYLLIIFKDITERKQAEDALLDSREYLNKIIDTIGDPIFVKDSNHRFVLVNDAQCNLAGHSREELLGKTDYDFFPKDQADVFWNRDDNVLVTGKENVNEELITDTHGVVHTIVTKKTLYTDAGENKFIVGIIRDISERKKEEEKLRKSEEKYRLISENVADLIAVIDLDGKRIYNSPSYKDLLGDPGRFQGTDSFQEIHLEDREKIKKIFSETVRSGMGRQAEYRFVAIDGKNHFIESRSSVIRDSSGNVANVIVLGRDVTDKKLMEQQLLRSQRMESLGTLAGGISHDLNNVLAPILLALNILKTKYIDEYTQKIITTMETSALRGRDIIKQVLTFARGMEGEFIVLQPKHLVLEIENIIYETFPRSITLRTNIQKDTWTIYGDATQIHQVLLNLCVNARDAMPNGGELQLSVENITLDENYARMSTDARPGRYVCISVADTGIGIPPNIKNRIFEPFFTTKEVGKGTGLGLSVTHSIIEGHKGFINVYSEVGKGSTFNVYFPAAEKDEIQKATVIKPELPAGQGETILVVDDESSILDITRDTLLMYSYNVLTATDGAEAIAIYAQHKDKVDVVISDIMMPNLDGITATRAMRRMNQSLNIILTSGRQANDPISPKIDFVVQAFLRKPYTAETLLNLLRKTLDKKIEMDKHR